MNNDDFNVADLFLEEYNELQGLNEANTTKGFDSIVSNMFGHLLKYTHQPEKQTSMWVKTIARNNREINKLYPKLKTTERNIITKDTNKYLDDRFVEGLALLRNETGISLKIPRYIKWDFDFIFNGNRIKNYLLENINKSILIDNIEGTIYDSF